MCKRCGDTFFRAIEGKSITSIWEPVVKNEEYTIPPEGIRFFVACAGLHKYPDDNGIVLRDTKNPEICSISSATKDGKEQDGINLLSYQHPRIAQSYLQKKGSKS